MTPLELAHTHFNIRSSSPLFSPGHQWFRNPSLSLSLSLSLAGAFAHPFIRRRRSYLSLQHVHCNIHVHVRDPGGLFLSLWLIRFLFFANLAEHFLDTLLILFVSAQKLTLERLNCICTHAGLYKGDPCKSRHKDVLRAWTSH